MEMHGFGGARSRPAGGWRTSQSEKAASRAWAISKKEVAASQAGRSEKKRLRLLRPGALKKSGRGPPLACQRAIGHYLFFI